MRAPTTLRLTIGLLLLAPTFSWAETDRAAELGRFLGAHGYGTMQVDVSNNAEELEAKIDGHTVFLDVDTGCDFTCLTENCARHLKLDVHDAGYEDWGAGGKINGHMGIAKVGSFTLNDYEINRTNILKVLPREARLGRIDGYFGLDFMRYNAVILPVGAKVLLFKPGNTAVPPIESYMTAMGFKAVPLHYTAHELFIEGELNGQPCRAMIDSGCEYSVFDLDYVLKVHGGNVMFDRMRSEGLDRNRLDAFVFVPNRLRLGTLVLDKTDITAAKTPSFSHMGFQALFGYDLLAAHNAILDLGHNQLWIK